METQQLQYKLSAFEGPLDLLLTLISKNKIDIYDISISELLDQYMEQINMMQENQMDIASEFLTMPVAKALRFYPQSYEQRHFHRCHQFWYACPLPAPALQEMLPQGHFCPRTPQKFRDIQAFCRARAFS